MDHETIIYKFLKIVLPLNGVTPKYTAGVLLFVWTHAPVAWLPAVAQIVGVIVLVILPIIWTGDQIFNRVLLVGMLLVISQVAIPGLWKMFQAEPGVGPIAMIGLFALIDYCLVTEGWSALDKRSSKE